MYCINCAEPLIFFEGTLIHEETYDQACEPMTMCKVCGYELEYYHDAWHHIGTPASACDCPVPSCGDLAQVGWPFSGHSDARNVCKVVGDDVYILRHCAPGTVHDSEVRFTGGLMCAPQSRFEASKIRFPYGTYDDATRTALRVAVNLWNVLADHLATPAGHVLNALHDMDYGAVGLVETGGVWRVMEDGDLPARPGYIVISAKGDDTAVREAQLRAAMWNNCLWTVTKLPIDGSAGVSVTGVAFDNIGTDGWSTPTDAELTALFTN